MRNQGLGAQGSVCINARDSALSLRPLREEAVLSTVRLHRIPKITPMPHASSQPQNPIATLIMQKPD